jgi:hypothetical protein
MPLFNPASVTALQQVNSADSASAMLAEIFSLESTDQTSALPTSSSVVTAFVADTDRVGQQIWVPDTSSVITNPVDGNESPVDPEGYILLFRFDAQTVINSIDGGTDPNTIKFLKLTPGSYWEPPKPYTGEIAAMLVTESTTAGISFIATSYQI